MKFNPKALEVREAVAGGVIVFLLLAGSCLLVLGLKHGGWVMMRAGCLIDGGCLTVLWAIGGETWIGCFLATPVGWIRGWRYQRAEMKYHEKLASEATTAKLAYLEERFDKLAGLRLNQRLADLEQAEAWRTQQEWSELRDVWRVLILDPKTPEELRDSCREWLAKYPEALDFTTRRLEQMGLLKGKDLLFDENWENHERRKWRVQ